MGAKAATEEKPAETAHNAQPATTPTDPWAVLDGIIESYKVSTPEGQAKVREHLGVIFPAPVTDTDVRCTTYNAMSRSHCNALLAEEATRPYRLYCRRCHLHTYSPEHPAIMVAMEANDG